jgi:archaemetzincin
VTSAIKILNGTSLEREKLDRIAAIVGGIFEVGTAVLPSSIDIGRAFDRSRGQHNSTALLAQLNNVRSPLDEKAILVVDVDLYIPVLTFVFGEAQLNGPAAVVSTHRLQNQFYGMAHDDEMMLKRLEKEIIHELGHTFGLYHCLQFECVMRSSTYVEEIDLKQTVPCGQCLEKLKSPA